MLLVADTTHVHAVRAAAHEAAPGERVTSRWGHQASGLWSVEQQSGLATDEVKAVSSTFNGTVPDCVHDENFVNFEQSSQCVLHDHGSATRLTAIETTNDIRVIEKDVVNLTA